MSDAGQMPAVRDINNGRRAIGALKMPSELTRHLSPKRRELIGPVLDRAAPLRPDERAQARGRARRRCDDRAARHSRHGVQGLCGLSELSA